jgi:steroid 5-alpha reductase family enzyme
MIAAACIGLAAALVFALATWAVSLAKRDASIVDSVWSLMILVCGLVYAALLPPNGPLAAWMLVLAALWALRLSAYISWRNWGEPEDRRYRAIRERNEPGFAFKSVYLVFGLQAVLAWLVSAPLLGARMVSEPVMWLGATGCALAAYGIGFEALADWQVARWRRTRSGSAGVLDRGLWRYSRHPNYFGEFCVWWGLGIAALAVGAWWALVSPLLMTVLLLRVSGVTLLEQDLKARKPAYRMYAQRTNAFFPWWPKQ